MYAARYENRFSERLLSELESLRINEARLRTLIENAPDEFYPYDMKGRIMDVNNSICDTLGYTQSELESKTVFDFETSSLVKKLIKTVWPSLETGASYTISGTHICKNGRAYPVEIIWYVL